MNDTTTGESPSETPESVTKAATRRRASRAAGPSTGVIPETTSEVVVESPSVVKVRRLKPLGPPPRRQSNRLLVAGLALGITAVLVAVLAGVVALLFTQQRHAEGRRYA